MRVLQLCTNFLAGGIQRHVLELSGWLRERGHTVALGGSPGDWMEARPSPEFLPLDLMGVSGRGGPLARRLAAAAGCAMTLRRFLKAQEIELIHAHESAPALTAWLAARGLGVPIVLTYHGSEPERVAAFGRIAALSARRVLTPSLRTARDLREAGRVPAERVQTVGLGVRPFAVPSPDEVSALRERLLAGRRRLVVTVARLTHQKGIDLLVEVVRGVTAKRPDVAFVVVGDGPQRDLARQWAEAAGVASSIAFEGRSDRPELYLAAADLFLLTSRWEALPFSIAEAFQMGLPALAADCGGVAELIDDTVGRVSPVGDVEAMARAVLEVVGDDALRADMASAALARSREDRFSPEHIHAQIEAIYREVLAGRGSRVT